MTSTADPLAKYQFKTPEDVSKGGVTLAFYAPPGAGKTSISMTGMDFFKRPDVVGPHARALILDAEGGLRPIKSRGDFVYEEMTNWRQFEKITDDLMQTPDLRERFPLILVDNFSEFADYGLASLLKNADEDEATFGNGIWRRFKQLAMTRVRRLRDSARLQRVAVVFNLWDRENTDKEGNVRSISAGLIPSLVKSFGGSVDFFGNIEVGESDGHREIHFGTNSKMTSKSRLDLGDPIEAAIPLDLYGPPRPAILSIAPLLATLMGGEPFPTADYAPPQGARPSRFADMSAATRPANGAAAARERTSR